MSNFTYVPRPISTSKLSDSNLRRPIGEISRILKIAAWTALITFAVMATAFSIVLLAGCAHSPPAASELVPNLHDVRKDDARGAAVRRSGCPDSSSWPGLANQGTTDAIKLSYDDECDTSAAAAAGVEIHHVPIPPSTLFAGINEAVASVFAKPPHADLRKIYELVLEIRDERTDVAGRRRSWIVFCRNGNDRTGMTVNWTRRLVDGWSRETARKEMLDMGYHRELVGLEEALAEFNETSPPSIR
jgi:hypothetical protein